MPDKGLRSASHIRSAARQGLMVDRSRSGPKIGRSCLDSQKGVEFLESASTPSQLRPDPLPFS